MGWRLPLSPACAGHPIEIAAGYLVRMQLRRKAAAAAWPEPTDTTTHHWHPICFFADAVAGFPQGGRRAAEERCDDDQAVQTAFGHVLRDGAGARGESRRIGGPGPARRSHHGV